MALPQQPAGRDNFALVDRGWDPEEVRAFIAGLADEITALETRLAKGEATIQAPPARRAEHSPGSVVAEAEHHADQVRRRALADAKRLRSRAWEEGRDTSLQARRDALNVVKQARKVADHIVRSARDQVAGLHERARTLQEVVRRTEVLLRELASGDLGGPAIVAETQERTGEAGIGADVVVDVEESRPDRVLPAAADPERDRISGRGGAPAERAQGR